MTEASTVVVNVPLSRGSDAEAIDVSLGFGGYGVQTGDDVWLCDEHYLDHRAGLTFLVGVASNR